MALNGSTALGSRRAPSGGAAPGPSARQVRRRRSLPGGRAVVGGFLVAASAAGAFAASRAADQGPTSAYVVVRDDVAVGERLTADHLDLVAVDLPDAQRRTAFTEATPLEGATALGPLAAGQLVQISDVAKPVGAPALAQISIPVEAGRALNGAIRPGERVDVIVTYARAGEPETATISPGATVVAVEVGDDVVGRSGAVVAVLAVPPGDLEAVAEAGAAGTVTLARTTGVARPASGGT